MENFLGLERLGENCVQIRKKLGEEKNLALFGVPKSLKTFISARLGKNVVYVCRNILECEDTVKSFQGAMSQVLKFKGKPEVLVPAKALSKVVLHERLTTLDQILHEKDFILVGTIESFLQLVPKKEEFLNRTFTLKTGENYSLDELKEKLVKGGYQREDRVEEMGQFSLRGDILDIYLPSGNPVRLDFFDNQLEKIKVLDLESYQSKETLKEVRIFPATDLLTDDFENLEKRVKEVLPRVTTKEQEIQRADLLENLTNEISSGVLENNQFLPLVTSELVFSYLSDFYVVFEDPYLLEQTVEIQQAEHMNRFGNLGVGGEILLSQKQQLQDLTDLKKAISHANFLTMSKIPTGLKSFAVDEIVNVKAQELTNYSMDFDALVTDLGNWRTMGYDVNICCGDQDRARDFASLINEKSSLVSTSFDSSETKGLNVTDKKLKRGFILHDAKMVVIGEDDIFKKKKEKVLSRKHSKAFTSFLVGEYVVHETHGIGHLVEIGPVTTAGKTRDCAKVVYKDGTLYVPCENLDILSRYSGSDQVPSLSKLGGREFEKVKQRVIKSIKEMAFDLRELYKRRERKDGFVFDEDSSLQLEFEESFPFEETEDQIKAIQDVKGDMTSKKIMDRLICGDVGYGKTEVALRGIFKAVESGKQVCFLAPTTILSMQHFKTCQERLSPFGIRVDYLNRFKTKQNQMLTIDKIQRHQVDVVCGTHRLLSKDVIYSDLGLLILDEEQRFGVEDKEKIKAIKSDVDVLAMSATPIPRTLHMSLSGIRDISTLETPPKLRLPVQTIVTEQRDSIIRDAITRELMRDGQVFLLYNKVESIYSFASKIQNLVPEGKVIVSHGQLPAKVLEENIRKFLSKEANILVATTIVENGIDIPNANTMVVIDADKLGLSQLYQLKGRVGRSNRLAYVYFTYKENRVLSENAYKRLSAITEFQEFGSGFKIAMRDLEIRGAGNILGKEQHGHMEKVGYDMYTKLLKETVGRMHGTYEPMFPTKIEVDVETHLSKDYVPSSIDRMEIYESVSTLLSSMELEKLQQRMQDNFGTLPRETKNLLAVGLVKNLASKLYAKTVKLSKGGLEITLTKMSLTNPKVSEFLTFYDNVCHLENGEEPKILFKKIKKDYLEGVVKIFKILETNQNS